ncbi:ABC transporter permease, partial [Mesorhizobium sp. M7A.F.Ca.ET.027.02.1.1]
MSAVQTTSPAPDDTRERGPLAEVLFSLLRSRTFLVGLAIVLFWIPCALFGEHFVPY